MTARIPDSPGARRRDGGARDYAARMDASSRTIKAALLYEDGQTLDSVVLVPLIGGCPPGQIRVTTTFCGALAYDVYQLEDDSDYSLMPAYPYLATIPLTTEDLRQDAAT